MNTSWGGFLQNIACKIKKEKLWEYLINLFFFSDLKHFSVAVSSTMNCIST